MSQPVQSLESHAKFVPLYHYWTGSTRSCFPTLWFGYRMIVDFSMDSLAFCSRSERVWFWRPSSPACSPSASRIA